MIEYDANHLYSVKEIAQILGIHPHTLRNWDKAGKISVRRNKLNNYRVYTASDLSELIKLRGGNEKRELDQVGS